jgi:probable rRNA maturation factor
MAINFFKEDVACPGLSQDKYREWIQSMIEKYGKKAGEITYVFVSDEYLYKMNKEYLHHDYYTDVITFDYTKDNVISGDIFISVDRVKENAEEYGVTFLNELSRVMIHGVLHLIGFDDATYEEKKEMRKRENEALRMLEEEL